MFAWESDKRCAGHLTMVFKLSIAALILSKVSSLSPCSPCSGSSLNSNFSALFIFFFWQCHSPVKCRTWCGIGQCCDVSASGMQMYLQLTDSHTHADAHVCVYLYLCFLAVAKWIRAGQKFVSSWSYFKRQVSSTLRISFISLSLSLPVSVSP